MKRFLMASTLAVFVSTPGIASARLSHSAAVAYGRAYAHVSHKLGVHAAGCKLIGPHATCHNASDAKVLASTDVLHRMLAPVHITIAYTANRPTSIVSSSGSGSSSVSGSGGYNSVPGVPGGFAACVALRESSNGAGSPNIYGILPSNGYYPGMSVGAQKALFSRMYGADGTAPWAPYDGC